MRWLCWIGLHIYGPVRYQAVQGFDLAMTLRPGVVAFRVCVHCGRHQWGEARVVEEPQP